MAKKWTLANAVKKFKPSLKDSLRKNNGNLNTDVLNSLIKEMNCYYDEVTVEGRGRDRIIYTDKKRKEKAEKEDKRQFNKGVAPPHSKHLALMVMSKMDGIDNKERTSKGWATYFELISFAERDIMNGIFSKEVLKPYKTFMINLGIMKGSEGKAFQDLAYTLSKVAKGQLQTVLDQAEKMKLISRISSWKGKAKYTGSPIDIKEALAMKINFTEAQLLKKHEISKTYSLIIKNCPRTKAFKADWLEYIENVEDTEGDAMYLQYIYEVFRIEVLNKYAFDEYINANYPTEIDSFHLPENKVAYNSKLLDYVVENAQKKHDKSLEFKSTKLKMDEDTIEFFSMLNITKEEAIAQAEEAEMQIELTPYEAFLNSGKYVDCIRNLHIQLHGMGAIEIMEVKAVQHKIDEDIKKENAQLGLSNPAKVKNEKSVMKEISNYEEPSIDTFEQQEELTNIKRIKQQENATPKEIVLENLEQQGIATVDNPIVELTEHYYTKENYENKAIMEDIEEEIREYEDMYGDKAMEHIAVDTVVRELTRKVTAEEMIAEFKHEVQSVKERERKEWEKLFEGGQPVKREQTTNNPLEVFNRIRYKGEYLN